MGASLKLRVLILLHAGYLPPGRGSSVPADLPTQACYDTPGWTNGYGNDCAWYAANRCNGGQYVGASTYLTDPADRNYPNQNCCACGKATASFITQFWNTGPNDCPSRYKNIADAAACQAYAIMTGYNWFGFESSSDRFGGCSEHSNGDIVFNLASSSIVGSNLRPICQAVTHNGDFCRPGHVFSDGSCQQLGLTMSCPEGKYMSCGSNGTGLPQSSEPCGSVTDCPCDGVCCCRDLPNEACTIINPSESDRDYSSIHDNDLKGTGHAQSMLDSPTAWSALIKSAGQWMSMDLGSIKSVTGVVTQERKDKPTVQYVTSFTIQYSIDGQVWQDIVGKFWITNTESDNRFSPVNARYVKLVVQSWQGHLSMRAGVIPTDGCYQAWGCTTSTGSGCASCVPQASRTSDTHCATCNIGYAGTDCQVDTSCLSPSSSGCFWLTDKWSCLSSVDGRTGLLEKDGHKIYGEPCVWCGSEPDSCGVGSIYKPRCEPYAWMVGAGYYNSSRDKVASCQAVSCGTHDAATCNDCPQGNGELWCNGDCQWIDGNCVAQQAGTPGGVRYSYHWGYCRDSNKIDVTADGAPTVTTQLACASSCSSDAACTAYEWYPTTVGYMNFKCWTFPGSPGSGGSSSAPPTQGGGVHLDAECYIKEACDNSEQACRNTASKVGLQLGGEGYSFAGDYAETGCYAYSSGQFSGRAYYGYADSGGEVVLASQLTSITDSSKYRICGQAWGCTTGTGIECASCAPLEGRTSDSTCATCNSGYSLSGTVCLIAEAESSTTMKRCEGSLRLEVANAEAFVNEPNVTTLFKRAIAGWFKVALSWIFDVKVFLREKRLLAEPSTPNDSTFLSHLATRSSRRILMATGDESEVDVTWSIEIPPGSNDVTVNILVDNYNQQSVSEITGTINALIAEGLLGDPYEVNVTWNYAWVPEPDPTPDEPKEDSGMLIIIIVIVCVSVAVLVLVASVLVYLSRNRMRSAFGAKKQKLKARPFETIAGPLRSTPLEELFLAPAEISAEKGAEVEQLLRAIYECQEEPAKVFIVYAMGSRGDDAEGFGPGLYHVAALAKFFYDSGIPCFCEVMLEEFSDKKLRRQVFNAQISPKTSQCQLVIVALTDALFQCTDSLKDIYAAQEHKLKIFPLRLEHPIANERTPWPQVERHQMDRMLMASSVERGFCKLNSIPSPPYTVQDQPAVLQDMLFDLKELLGYESNNVSSPKKSMAALIRKSLMTKSAHPPPSQVGNQLSDVAPPESVREKAPLKDGIDVRGFSSERNDSPSSPSSPKRTSSPRKERKDKHGSKDPKEKRRAHSALTENIGKTRSSKDMMTQSTTTKSTSSTSKKRAASAPTQSSNKEPISGGRKRDKMTEEQAAIKIQNAERRHLQGLGKKAQSTGNEKTSHEKVGGDYSKKPKAMSNVV